MAHESITTMTANAFSLFLNTSTNAGIFFLSYRTYSTLFRALVPPSSALAARRAAQIKYNQMYNNPSLRDLRMEEELFDYTDWHHFLTVPVTALHFFNVYVCPHLALLAGVQARLHGTAAWRRSLDNLLTTSAFLLGLLAAKWTIQGIVQKAKPRKRKEQLPLGVWAIDRIGRFYSAIYVAVEAGKAEFEKGLE